MIKQETKEVLMMIQELEPTEFMREASINMAEEALRRNDSKQAEELIDTIIESTQANVEIAREFWGKKIIKHCKELRRSQKFI